MTSADGCLLRCHCEPLSKRSWSSEWLSVLLRLKSVLFVFGSGSSRWERFRERTNYRPDRTISCSQNHQKAPIKAVAHSEVAVISPSFLNLYKNLSRHCQLLDRITNTFKSKCVACWVWKNAVCPAFPPLSTSKRFQKGKYVLCMMVTKQSLFVKFYFQPKWKPGEASAVRDVPG